MTTQYVSYNSYYGHECRWNDSTSATSVSIAPSIYRWDFYDVYASESFTETLTEPNGSTGSWSYTKSISTSGGYTFLDDFGTRTYQRKESAYNIVLKFSFQGGSSWSGSYHSVSSSATFTLTVPALQSYSVTYDANGGSGAPGNQTKYYGKSLTLSTATPARSGYNFLGWATSSSATTASYQPGASYTGNAALALYAVWQQAIVPPTVTLTAYRTQSEVANPTTDPAEDLSADMVYVKAVWAKGDNNVGSVQWRYSTNGANWSSWATMNGTTSGASGTAKMGNIYLRESSYMSIEVKATDGTVTDVSTTVSTTVPSIDFPLYIYDQSKVRIHELHTEDLTERGTDIPGQTGTITRVYTSNGFTLEKTTFYISGDVVTVPIQFSSTTAFSGNSTTVVASIPEEYAPPDTMRFPLFTADWTNKPAGYLIINTSGQIMFYSGSCSAWFGVATYVRKHAGWTSS